MPWTVHDAGNFLGNFKDIRGLDSYGWDWEGLYRGVEKTAEFKKFARAQNVDIKKLEWNDRQDFANTYVSYFLERYLPGSLETLQDIELKNSLEGHGARIKKGESGRQALQRISEKNLGRMLSAEERSQAAKASPEAMTAVSDMRISFLHNTANNAYNIKVPLVAANEIRDLGAAGNLKNTRRFNRKFLKTSGNVFAFADFAPKFGALPLRSGSYGNYPVYIDADYMRDHGWISSFVMYRGELAQMAMHHFPLTRKLVEHAGNWNPIALLLKRPLKMFLYRTDFTVSDFETLVRTKILVALSKMDPQSDEYKSFLRTLKSGWGSPSLKEILKQYVYTPLNLSTSGQTDGFTPFEGKVPVAVPNQYLKFGLQEILP